MKNPVPPLANTEENRKELEKITPEIWDELTDSKKLGRIALHESLKNSNLLKIEYDKEKIIKNYNRERNSKFRKRNKESLNQDCSKKIDKLIQEKCELQEEKISLEDERDLLREEKNKLEKDKEILDKNYNTINRRYNRALKAIEDQKFYPEEISRLNTLINSCNEEKEKYKENLKVLKEKLKALEMEILKADEFRASAEIKFQKTDDEISKLNHELTEVKISDEKKDKTIVNIQCELSDVKISNEKKDKTIVYIQEELYDTKTSMKETQGKLFNVENSVTELNRKNEILSNEVFKLKTDKDRLEVSFRNVMSAHSSILYRKNTIEQGIGEIIMKLQSIDQEEIILLKQELINLVFGQ